MQNELQINFFPMNTSSLCVSCYRRMCDSPNEKKPDTNHYRFKERSDDEDAPCYWLTRNSLSGYEEYQFQSDVHPMAARWVLSQQFLAEFQKTIEDNPSYKTRLDDSFSPKLEVMVKEFPGIGWQGFIVEFDWQPELRRHGLYVNFHFFKNDGVAYSENIQRLSLSLDANGKPNRNLYRHQRDWLKAFFTRFLQGKTWQLHEGGPTFSFGEMASLPAFVLHSKVFEFGDGVQNTSPYMGLKKSGPFTACKFSPTFFFVFREEHIQTARFLYECLCGREFPERFPGMSQFFGVQFDKNNIRHIRINENLEASYRNAAKTIASEGCENPVAIVLVTGDEYEYYLQKSIFLEAGIPSQDVKVNNARAGRHFQWSVAGVALQLFCKSGGIPWCVQTPRKQDLIIGISQLWSRDDGESKRFVAYSITTDASGSFRDIRTLANKTSEDEYVSELALQIKLQLTNNIKKEHPKRIVLHCSFRLQRSALDAIRRVVQEVLKENYHATQIVVARVNSEHHYQGFDGKRETLIPDENTFMKVRRSTYLIWPDGTPSGGVAPSRPSNPVFIAFDRADPPINEHVERELLQDLCNLSGVNWRGFNAKARPVSVFYCSLVGKIISEMDSHNLPIPSVEKFVPWFL